MGLSIRQASEMVHEIVEARGLQGRDVLRAMVPEDVLSDAEIAEEEERVASELNDAMNLRDPEKFLRRATSLLLASAVVFYAIGHAEGRAADLATLEAPPCPE